MFRLVRRIGRYFSAGLNSKFDELADPKIQLEQAITEAQDQHRSLREQAAIVIANQKQTEMRLNRAMGELEKLTGAAQQAVLMAEEASKQGRIQEANDYARAAEAFANRLVGTEEEVETLKTLHLQSSEAADKAKKAVSQNANALQRRLTERQKLLSQLDQAKMQEQINKATALLSENVGSDVPSLEEVRAKIEARYAKALGVAELQEESVERHMLEVEQAALDKEARDRLDKIRAQLGLPAAKVGTTSLDEGSSHHHDVAAEHAETVSESD